MLPLSAYSVITVIKVMKLKKSYIIVAVILMVGGYYWYSKSKTNTVQARYVTAIAEKGTLTTAVSGSGNVVVDQIANVDPTITGTVANLFVAVGDAVKKGQLLFTIDNSQFPVNNAQAKVSLQNAQVAVAQAKANYADRSGTTERGRAILKQKIAIAEQDLSVEKLSYQKTLTDSAKSRVTSPIDGTVNAVNIKNGDDLSKLAQSSTRQAPIIIGDLGTLKAQVQVNEVDISNVQVGQKATLSFGAINGVSISGKVEKMDALGTITQSVVTYNVTIDFDIVDPRIKPEMSVSAAIISDVKQDILIVPSGAIKTQDGFDYVEILNNGQPPEQVPVKIGTANNTQTEILTGIKEGDKVVTQTIVPGATASSGTQGGFRLPGFGGRGGG